MLIVALESVVLEDWVPARTRINQYILLQMGSEKIERRSGKRDNTLSKNGFILQPDDAPASKPIFASESAIC